MNQIDSLLINRLQEGLPLAKDPYGIIAGELGIARSDLVQRITRLTKEGYIRRIGGVFDTKAMGYTSLLVGASVPEDIFAELARYLLATPGVTHNYRRDGRLNMWFTLTTPSQEESRIFLQQLQELFPSAKFYPLPRITNFKLKVFFEMKGERE